MPLPQRYTGVTYGAPRLSSLTRKHRGAHIQTGKTEVIQRDVLGQMACVRQSKLLVRSLQRRGAVVFQLQRRGECRELREEVPVTQIDSGSHTCTPGEPKVGVTMQADPTLTPRAGDDQCL